MSPAAAASSTACATRSATGFFAVYKAGEPRPDVGAARGRAHEPRLSASPAAARSIAPARSRFTFDGVAYGGYAGDTLASALLANGVHLVGRSYKYHRPRGILVAGAEEPNALVGVSRGPGRFTPNLRATQVELHDGLVAASQNRWPSLGFDLGAVNDLLSPLYRRGFYYKTFMGPNVLGKNWAWKRVYEPAIRRAAGLGTPPDRTRPRRYAAYFEHCDVLVVGAGPAGLAAALAAGAERRAASSLCDEKAEFGGSLLAETRARDRRPERARLARASARRARRAAERAADAAHPGVRLLRAELRRAQRARHRARADAGRRGAARAALAGAGARGRAGDAARSSGRWCSPTTIGRA